MLCSSDILGVGYFFYRSRNTGWAKFTIRYLILYLFISAYNQSLRFCLLKTVFLSLFFTCVTFPRDFSVMTWLQLKTCHERIVCKELVYYSVTFYHRILLTISRLRVVIFVALLIRLSLKLVIVLLLLDISKSKIRQFRLLNQFFYIF